MHQPHKPELLQPGCFYHIYNWGNNHQPLFFEPRNYPYFLQLWTRYIHPIADTFAYALLPNHFHCLIRVKKDLSSATAGRSVGQHISQQFAHLFNTYAKSINKAYGRTGSLFQERFRRKKIEDENACRELILYIHTNPELHRLAADFRSYPHTSFAALACTRPTRLMRHVVWELFGGVEAFLEYHALIRANDLDLESLLEYPHDDTGLPISNATSRSW